MNTIVLRRYSYDPLDRIAGTTLDAQTESKRFYCKSHLNTQIHDQSNTRIFRHDDLLLAQQGNCMATLSTALLITDCQRSVLGIFTAEQVQPIAYSPYGHRTDEHGSPTLMAFNGELRDQLTGCYLLGNGYRAFNTALMRFHSSDSWSPFAKGGLNSYTYCSADPVNRRDPNGHSPMMRRSISLTRFETQPRIPDIPVPIRMQVNYPPMARRLNRNIMSRPTGSLESLASSSSIDTLGSRASSNSISSLDSPPSHAAFSPFGSDASIASSVSTRSAVSTPPRSRQASISSDSDWSGSGRRRDDEWGSNESLTSVSSYSSQPTLPEPFDDTSSAVISTSPRNAPYRSDLMPGQASRIRRAHDERR
jgi:RHS repeat-associated protein